MSLLPSRAARVALPILLLACAALSAAQPAEDLRKSAERAQAAMAAGRFDEAARLYQGIVRTLPNEPGMRLNLGMALSLAGRPRAALPELEAAHKLAPDLLPASLFLGSVRLELGQPAAAVEPLQAFVDAEGDHPEARRMLADALLTLERCTPAGLHYRALARQVPRDPRAWFGLGRSQECIARHAFETLQRTAPESPWILLLVAEGLVATDRDKAAFRLYREALEKRPGLVEAHAALAGIYERTGHADWAETERAAAAALPAPDCRSARPECDLRAGRAQAVLDDAATRATPEGLYWRYRAADVLARQAFGELETLGPSPELTLVRAQVLRGQRRYAELKEALESAIERWPQDRRLTHELATLLFMANEQAAARELLERLLRSEPDSAELNQLLGQSWLESREPARAIPFLERAVRGDPERLLTRGALGRAYLDAGQAERAVPMLEAALPTDADGSLLFQLARAYQELGQTERARQAREDFQKLQRANREREEEETAEFAITPPS